jgi:hypothetical protein
VRVFKTGWFARYARKEWISDRALWSTIVRAEDGLIDAYVADGTLVEVIGDDEAD